MKKWILAMAVLALCVQSQAVSSRQTQVGEPESAVSQPAKETATDLRLFWKEGLRMETADGNVKLKTGGRFMYDSTWVSEDPSIRANVGNQLDGSETRRARLYTSGKIYENVEFKLQFDFAGGTTDLEDAFIGLTEFPVGKVRAGHFKEPLGLEELTSSNYMTFIERSLPIGTFSPGRNAGLMLFDTACSERMTWAVGVFRPTDDQGSIKDDGGYTFTGRVTTLPVYEDDGAKLLHLGAAYSYRNTQYDSTLNGDVASFGSRPEAHLLDSFVSTGDFLSENVQLTGLEAAWVSGPFSAQGEYLWARAQINSHANFTGYYVQGSYFLTGEHRNYKPATGTFGGIKPKANYSQRHNGAGAWELAVRYSELDLNDAGITGGKLNDITGGVNWHLNPNMRFMLNYIHADKKNVGQADIGILRLQLNF